jgi:hypothetical protein
MAGEVEIALQVLSHINRENPAIEEAWLERLELLFLLERREELAQALALSRAALGPEKHRVWLDRLKRQEAEPEGDVEAAAAPFERLRHRQDLIGHFMGLFSGREDCFARQWADKTEAKQGYVPVRRSLEPQDVEDHLGGRKTYGIYLLKSDNTIRAAVIDADLKKERRGKRPTADDRALVKREGHYLFSRIGALAKKAGLKPLVEFSGGKGFHFWFLFDAPVDPGLARKALDGITRSVSGDLSAFNLEVFPKQDQLAGKGFGNLVKLPLGIHRLTGKRSRFIECADRSVDGQLAFLFQVRPSRGGAVLESLQSMKAEKLVVLPRFQKWASEYPELSTLEACCPPIGQILAGCRQGRPVSLKEERVIYQTVGFLKRAKTLLHHLMASVPEYNPHLVDFNLSRVKGRPLGCRRIHSLLGFTGDFCVFKGERDYEHPILHLGEAEVVPTKAEKSDNLSAALENLTAAIVQVQRFLT